MPEYDEIKIETSGKMILAALQRSNVDEEATRAMQDRVAAAAEQAPKVPVILDLSVVEFMPSLSLGVLVTMLQTFKKEARRFILVGLRPRIRETLTMCRLIKLFEIYDTVEEAVRQIRKPA
jgi:anti-sigma B factor antagonist